MISYDNRGILDIFLKRAGSVAFRLTTILPAIASTVCCALLLYNPDVRRHFLIPGSIARIYATVLGFVIAFRARMAFGRYFDGVNYAYTMFSEWRDAFSSLSAFLEASIVQHQKLGHTDAVRELAISKARLAHWFSMLLALAVQKLRGEEGEVGCEQCIEREFPSNRFRRSESYFRSWSMSVSCAMRGSVGTAASNSFTQAFVGTSDAEKLLYQEAVDKYGVGVQILGKVTPDELRILGEANDSLLCITKWILLEISSHSIRGRLLIAPPILSRAYAELSHAMMAFFQAMQIPLCPFPFPFAQFLQYALLWWICVCPFAVLITLDDPTPDLSKTWMALPLNYLACFGFVTLNEIAVELEEPFGEDDNDYPIHLQQWSVIWAMEDCYFADTPYDFSLQMLGPDAIQQADECRDLTRHRQTPSLTSSAPPPAPTAMPPSSSSSPLDMLPDPMMLPVATLADRATPETDVSALAANFQELRDAIDASVYMMESSNIARHHDVERIGKRLGGLLPGLSVPGPLSLDSAQRVKTHAKTSRGAAWQELNESAEPDNMDIDHDHLRELVKMHCEITQALQTLVAEHRREAPSLEAAAPATELIRCRGRTVVV